VNARRWILMGDPSHFSVQGGANPHTRTRWGTKRHVDRERAIAQWHALKSTLEDLGIRVLVVPPEASQPGLVYPANAGVMRDVDTPRPLAERRFLLANLLPTRAGEKAHYRRVLDAAGLPCEQLDESLRFEGEADFFPAGKHMLLTHGRLERQRFVPAWSIPPWKRVYGFRTDASVAPLLEPWTGGRKVLKLELTQEAHYHGDTVLAAFGPRREHLLAYRDGLTPEGWNELAARFGDHLVPLSEEDARHYAANSFTYTPPGQDRESFLLLPGGVSERLLAQVRDRGVTPLVTDVSEFLKKGGGSVKCMIGDLGAVESEPAS
jgi:N-dimethylarginine dimethylaminohydrolase